jgi:hypothetical protein
MAGDRSFEGAVIGIWNADFDDWFALLYEGIWFFAAGYLTSLSIHGV